MKPTALRLTLAAVLFTAWMGYLLYLVVGTLPRSPNDLPIVLSRPQVLVSEIDVVGIIGKDGEVKVTEVLYSKEKEQAPEKDATIKVANLDKVRILVKVQGEKEDRLEERKPTALEQTPLGPCILLLRRAGEDYEVVSLPSSPGTRFTSPRIYPATAETLAEYLTIKKSPDVRDKE